MTAQGSDRQLIVGWVGRERPDSDGRSVMRTNSFLSPGVSDDREVDGTGPGRASACSCGLCKSEAGTGRTSASIGETILVLTSASSYRDISISSCLYGPNTNVVITGSTIFFSECGMHYVMGCIRMLFENGYRSLECRKEVHDAYNVVIGEGNLQVAWGAPNARSWYQSRAGRVTQNWPFKLL